MNIKFITGWSSENEDPSDWSVSALNTLDLALCGQGRPEGNAAGLVPIQLTSGVVVTPVVTVTSSTSTTKRNSRSAVIKVSLPYTALTKDADGNTVADPTRSGTDLSVHIVLALPAAAVKDIKGTNGETSKLAAEAQVALVHYLLMSVIGQQFGSLPVYTLETPEAMTGHLTSKVMNAPTIGGVADPYDYDATARAPMPSSDVGGYAGAGFDLSNVRVHKDLNGALGRIASGLPALSCADVVAYPAMRGVGISS